MFNLGKRERSYQREQFILPSQDGVNGPVWMLLSPSHLTALILHEQVWVNEHDLGLSAFLSQISPSA